MNKLIAAAVGSACLAAVSAGEPADSIAVFGSARERVLPFGVPCARWLFQFQGGRVFVSGHGPGTTPEQVAQDQKRIDNAGGIDLCAHGGKTVRGEVGILEILDIVMDKRGHSGDGKGYGMKFRYKMAQHSNEEPAEQGADQPATAADSKPEGKEKPRSEAEGRSQ